MQFSNVQFISVYTAAAAASKSLQSCLTLCDPIDGSPPGSPVPGILQARTLEWVAIAFSSAWKWKVKVKSLCHVRLLATPWTSAHQAPPSTGCDGGIDVIFSSVCCLIVIFSLVSSTFMFFCHADNFNKCRKRGWLILLLFPSLDPGYFSF